MTGTILTSIGIGLQSASEPVSELERRSLQGISLVPRNLNHQKKTRSLQGTLPRKRNPKERQTCTYI